MIKINPSIILDIQSDGKSLAQKHLDWFIAEVSKHKFRDTGETYKEFLIRILNLPTEEFEERIEPYLIGQRDEMEGLIKKHEILKGIPPKKKPNPEEEEIIERSKKISKAFCYDFFTDKESETSWGAYNFCQKLQVDVCPYCNRQYIYTTFDEEDDLDDNDESANSTSQPSTTSGDSTTEKRINYITRPELDHYYPKSIYPFLSCNLFNLIPSCSTCNHLKSDQIVCEKADEQTRKESQTPIIYPYEKQFGNDGVFRVKIDEEFLTTENLFDDAFLKDSGIDKAEIAIISSGNNKEEIEKSKEIFHLEEIYKMHKMDLSDFLNRYKKYCDPKRKEIIKLFHDSASTPIDDKQLGIFLNIMSSKLEKELLGMIECDDSKQYPLKKMKEDLKKQLDSSKTT